MSQQWHTEGACFQHPDPDLWFWETSMFYDDRKLNAYRALEAIDICNTCPVIELCLKEGMKDENIEKREEGGSVWGGKTTYERAMKRRMSPHSKRAFASTIKSEKALNDLMRSLRHKMRSRL